MTIIEKKGYCTLCRSRCGTVNLVDEDQDFLVKVLPDLSHPTGQALCMKGRAAPELVHSSERVTTPMRRTNPKGAADPGWVPISWDAAFSEVASRLTQFREESGAESVAFGITTPSGTPISDSIDWIERFIFKFGSPNIFGGTEVCNWHKDEAHKLTFGCGIPVADYSNSDLIILWGHNPTNTWLAQSNAIGKGLGAGSSMIVVDPLKTELAARAQAWLQVRPGTDGALALGLINALIEANAFDDAFVRAWSNAPYLVSEATGDFVRERDICAQALENRAMVWNSARGCTEPYDPSTDYTEAADHFAIRGSFRLSGTVGQIACAPAFERLAQESAKYPVERVAAISGVDPAEFAKAVALLTSSRRVAYHAWTGVAQTINATQTERAIATLYALTGSFDKPGGNRIYEKQPVSVVNDYKLLPDGQAIKALGFAERPIGPAARGQITVRDLYSAILKAEPYRVRAIVAFGTNQLVTQADPQTGEAALRALEFHVHCDLFDTPSSRYADIFLPINTPWEREGLRLGFEITPQANWLIQLRPQMVAPRGASRSDADIVFDLACRMGMSEAFFNGSIEAGWNHILGPTGISVDDLRRAPDGKIERQLQNVDQKYATRIANAMVGFATETGRVELYSEKLRRAGHAPVPVYEPPDNMIAGDDRCYPYVLTSRKNGHYCHSQHRSLASLRRRSPFPAMNINPALAANKGIAEGDWVQISTVNGVARFSARFDSSIAPDVMSAEFGWWQSCTALGMTEMPIFGAATSNYNGLVDGARMDPISGSTALRTVACNVERDLASDLSRRNWKGSRPFIIRDVLRDVDGVVALSFSPEDGGSLPDFRPGQHVTLRIAENGGQGDMVRAYSLVGPCIDSERTHYEIAVRHLMYTDESDLAQEGAMSAYLNKIARAGQRVLLGAPSGRFAMPLVSEQPVVLIAAGIGITPFLSYLESLVGQDEMPVVELHYVNRNRMTYAFRKRIENLARQLPRLNLHEHYTREASNRGTKRFSAEDVDRKILDARARVYMCGPETMLESMTQQLVARGVAEFDIFSEKFKSSVTADFTSVQPRNITFARSANRTEVWTPAHGNLLAFAEGLGVVMSSGCRVGQCESCAVKILSGTVVHKTDIQEQEEAVCLACQAVPMSDLVVDA